MIIKVSQAHKTKYCHTETVFCAKKTIVVVSKKMLKGVQLLQLAWSSVRGMTPTDCSYHCLSPL